MSLSTRSFSLPTFLVALTGLGALALSPAAHAQGNRTNEYGGGSRLPPQRTAQMVQRGPYTAEIVLQEFGRCLVERRMGSVEKVLALPIDAPDYERGLDALFASVGDNCLSGSGTLSFTTSLLRGALFEGLYRKKFGMKDPSVPQDAVAEQASLYAAPLSDQARRHAILQGFSECVVKARPDQARAMVLSTPGSSADQTSFEALRPLLAPCYPANTSLEVDRVSLRAMLAEALYRTSVNAQSRTAVGKN